MNFATLVVSLLLTFQTPLFIAAVVSSFWLSFRMSGRVGDAGPSNKTLAWVAFVTMLLMTVASAGEAILMLREGQFGGAVLPMFMTLLWGFFTRQSYRVLNVVG